MHIKIGTRGSKLALWQAEMVATKLQAAGATTEIITIETIGDKILNQPLAEIGSKGLFTEEIEQQLSLGNIDIAVHSAKDMQSTLPEDMAIIAFTEREKANDVLVSFDKEISLASGRNIIVGTSSARRRAILRYHFPHVNVVEMRGNLQTRIRKMQEGQCHAMILAYAGIHRMQQDELINEILPLDLFVPPVGQGCVAIEAHDSLEKEKRNLIGKTLNHADTALCVLEERKLLRMLDGGCSIPLFCMATMSDTHITMKAGIIDAQEKINIVENHTEPLPSASQCADAMMQKLVQKNIHEVLQEIRIRTHS